MDDDDNLDEVKLVTRKRLDLLLIIADQLSINDKGTKMAFCTDSGSVGVIDLQTNDIARMKQSHNNVSTLLTRGR